MRTFICLIMMLTSFLTNSVLAQHIPVELMNRIHLVPRPKTLDYNEKKNPFPKAVSIVGISLQNSEQISR